MEDGSEAGEGRDPRRCLRPRGSGAVGARGGSPAPCLWRAVVAVGSRGDRAGWRPEGSQRPPADHG
eukprot:9170093-Pyramimonas_sp.AAC.1